MRSLLRRNASPWIQGMPGLLLLVYVGVACGQPVPQAEPLVEPPQWECQELIRRSLTAQLQEGTLAQGTERGPSGRMRMARSRHTATLLISGKVLLTGGAPQEGSWIENAELYEPASGTWKDTGPLGTPRDNHMATLLRSGKVLVAGGFRGTSQLTSVELYDPDTEKWINTAPMAASRSSATMTCLPSGKVLVAGGYGSDRPNDPSIESRPLKSAEIYDPDTETWSTTKSPMKEARHEHAAALLPDGRVLVTGGQGEDNIVVESAEVYDPELDTWSETNSMEIPRQHHTATRLPSGRILVTGGSGTSKIAEAEEYDPITGTWTTIKAKMGSARDTHTATLLPSGKVLVAGGKGDGDVSLINAEVYDPGLGTWTALGKMNTPRFWHTATLLPSGKVLLAGGSTNEGHSMDAEVYDAVPDAPQVTSPTPGEDILDTWIPHIAGTAEPNSTVMLSLDGAKPIPVLADADGAWSYTPCDPLTIGPHTLSARAIDLAGNGSEPTSVTFQMVAKSHYGGSCSSTSAFPALGISLVVLGMLLRRGKRAHFH